MRGIMKSLRAAGIEIFVEQDRLSYRADDAHTHAQADQLIADQAVAVMDWLKQHPDFFKRRPVGSSQLSQWFLFKMNPESWAYNLAYAARLNVDFQPDLLGKAFAQMVEDHEALHCGYIEEDDEVLMYKPAVIVPDYKVIHTQGWDEVTVRAWLESMADKPFDVAAGQVCRFHILANNTIDGIHYYLSAGMHHIASDFLSFELLADQAFQIYETLQRGEVSTRDKASSYWSWLTEQQQLLTSDEGKALEQFWRSKLSGELSPLALTTDYPRPKNQGLDGAEQEWWASERESFALSQLADSWGLTTYTLLAALLQVFFHRYTDQSDFILGTPVAGRGKRHHRLIGYTLNSIPLRVQITGNPSLREFANQQHLAIRECLKHQSYPFALLVEKLEIVRDSSRSPLFQQMFTFVPVRERGAAYRHIQQEFIATQRGSANDLNVRFQVNGTRLMAQWRYATSLYRPASIARMLENFQTFIESVLADPEAKLDALAITTAITASIQQTIAGQPIAQTALVAFERHVAQKGESVALQTAKQSLTYRELDQQAVTLAQCIAKDIKSGGVVGLLLPRGTALVTGMLAAWKLGAAYVCLDTALPIDRLQYLIQDSGLRCVMGKGARPSWLADPFVAWLDVMALPQVDSRLPPVTLHPNQAAYVIYTSGSTGQPKGVVLSHANLTQYVTAVMERLDLTADASMSMLASTAADLGYTSLWGALLTGRRLRLINDAQANDPEGLAQALASDPIDCLKIVPSHLKALLSVSDAQRLLPRQALVLGGEGLDLTLLARIKQLAPQCRIVNHYGPTEATVGCIAGQAAELVTLSGYALLGRPLAGVQSYVLDRYLNPMPIGAAGELYIAGEGVAQGYLNRAGQTAERFVPNPFVADGKRLYRTGDQVRMLADGQIEFLGRIDQQVKIRGYRVEVGEIEAVLKSNPLLLDAAVIAQEGLSDQGLRLVAYIVARESEANGSVEELLRQALANQLPDYMVPSGWVVLDQLPLMPNGKVDRKQLSRVEQVTRKANNVHTAPRDPIEQRLVDLWQEILGCTDISVTDNFFARGGDSIRGLQLVAKARQSGIKFSPKQLFEQPTLADLAAVAITAQQPYEVKILKVWREILDQPQIGRVDNFFAIGGDSILSLQIIAKLRQQEIKITPKQLFELPTAAQLAELLVKRELAKVSAPVAKPVIAAPALPILPDHIKTIAYTGFDAQDIEDIYPLSPLQKGLLFHSLLEGETGVYFNQLVVEIAGAFHTDAFIRAWRDAVVRHPILRTSFVWQGLDDPLQRVHQKAEFGIQQLDWRTISADQQQQALQTLCQQDRKQGFKLESPALIRLTLIQVSAECYWLIWSRHHLIVDGWCSIQLLEEVLAQYQAHVSGVPAQLAARPAYREYLAWLHAQPEPVAQQFWQDALTGAMPTPMPMLQAMTHTHTQPQAYSETLIFDAATHDWLQQQAKQQHMTLNTLVQAAWGVLLARYSGQNDVVFGVTSAGRPADLLGAERILGVFINTLPLRIKLDAGSTAHQYLNQVQSFNAAMREFEHSALVDIQAWSGQPAGQALFDSLLVFQNLPLAQGRQIQVGDVHFKQLKNLEQTHYGLTLEVIPEQELWIDFSADRQRISSIALRAVMAHFKTILLQVAGQPNLRLGAIALLDDRERMARQRWSTTTADYDLSDDWVARFEQQVRLHPERIVARSGISTLSYAELERQSAQVAQGLRLQGTQSDDIVAVFAERDTELLVMLVGILRAGAAWMPLDPTHPPSRWQQVLEQARQPRVLVNEIHRQRLLTDASIPASQVMTVAELRHAAAQTPFDLQTLPAALPNQLAYVLFTSGSTGTPKGAMINRAGLLNNQLAKINPLQLGEQSVIAQTAPICFDISVWQCLIAPILGASVEFIASEIVRDPEQLLQVLNERQISHFEPVPSLLQALIDVQVDVQGSKIQALPHLRWVLPTGEALPTTTAQDWFKHYPNIPLMNAYGPAECADDVAFQPLTEAPLTGANMPIGRPTANAELYVLDQNLNQVPVGVVGELAVGGVGVGRGYLNDPQRSAAVFIPHPYSQHQQQGQRLYLTGDLARYRADGVLEYLGRKDFQVKLRGFRIELGEIETVLESHPHIQRTLVSASSLQGDQPDTLVGYWQAAESVSLDAHALTAWVQSRLPAYMVPTIWIEITEWPLTANGKVDRKALPVATYTKAVVSAPEGKTEIALATLWQQLLKIEGVGREDHFFHLGGHSLLATRLVSRIRHDWSIDLPLRAVFDAPILRDLAERIEQAQVSDEPVLQAVDRSIALPLSFAQQRLWLVEQLGNGGSAYNMAASLSLDGVLDPHAVQQTLQWILDRHEILRTAYLDDEDGEPYLEITMPLVFKLEYTDLSLLSESAAKAEAQQLADQHAKLPFDLKVAPLMRAHLVRLGDDQHRLLFAVHHIVADGWSIAVLTADFIAAYQSYSTGQIPTQAALPLQYADYALWQRQYLQDTRLQTKLTYWQQQLAAIPQLLNLPIEFPRPAVQSHSGDVVKFSLDSHLVKPLEALAQQQGVTLFMLLLAAFQVLLAKLTDSDDVVVGTDVAGRSRKELERLLGCFVNVLPIRTQVNSTSDFVSLLSNVRSTTLDAYEHQDLPFDRIVEALRLPRNRSYHPVVQALFVMQNVPQVAFSLPELVIRQELPSTRESKFDMALFLEPHAEGITGEWVYASSLFSSQCIEQFLAMYHAVLAHIVAEPLLALDQIQWPVLPHSQKTSASAPYSDISLDHHTISATQSATQVAPSHQDKTTMTQTPSVGSNRLGAKLDRLKKIAPRRTTPELPMKTSFLSTDGRQFPLVVEPTSSDIDPLVWAARHREWIEQQLCQHGGLLLRGFGLKTAQDFEHFAEAIKPGLYGGYGDLPKKEGGKNTYRSTPYPEREMILFHNESSHTEKWPRLQWFFCELPSPIGGATPIVDCREMYRRLPEDIRQQFEQKQLMYVRTFTAQLDVSWQHFFKTENRLEVEARCLEAGIDFEWISDSELQTRTICPAVITHPQTGEKSFFNQVQLHHVACLDADVRRDLLDMVGLERMPRHVYFGDGSTISDEVMAILGELYEACAVRFDWQSGDVVMLDNMLAAHARDPFEGPRKIVVAMGEMIQRHDLAISPRKAHAPQSPKLSAVTE